MTRVALIKVNYTIQVIIMNNTECTELTLPHSNINMQPKHNLTNILKYKLIITRFTLTKEKY
jgi:hypothetical protein